MASQGDVERAVSIQGLTQGLGALGLNLSAAQVERLSQLAGENVLKSIVELKKRSETPPALSDRPKQEQKRFSATRARMNNYKNLSSAVSGILIESHKDTALSQEQSFEIDKLGQRPRICSYNDSAPIRGLLQADVDLPSPVEAFLIPKSPRKRGNVNSQKQTFSGRGACDLLHQKQKTEPFQYEQCMKETKLMHNVSNKLFDQLGGDMSKLHDYFKGKDPKNTGSIHLDDLRAALNEVGGIQLLNDDVHRLVEVYQTQKTWDGKVNYEDFVSDLTKTAYATLPDTSLHQVNIAQRRTLGLQRRIGSTVLRASRHNARQAFSACSGQDGRVTPTSVIAHIEDGLQILLSSSDRADLFAELVKHTKNNQLDEKAFTRVLLGTPQHALSTRLWDDETKFAEHEHSSSSIKTNLSLSMTSGLDPITASRAYKKLEQWVASRTSKGSTMYNIYLQLDRELHSGSVASATSNQLKRLGLDVSGDEVAELRHIVSPCRSTAFAQFAKQMSTKDFSAGELVVQNIAAAGNQGREPLDGMQLPRNKRAQAQDKMHKTALMSASSNSASMTHRALQLIKTRRKSVNKAYLGMKQGQTLSSSDLYDCLCQAEHTQLDRAEFDETLHRAGIAPSCQNIRFDQFDRLLSLEAKRHVAVSSYDVAQHDQLATESSALHKTTSTSKSSMVLHMRAPPPLPQSR